MHRHEGLQGGVYFLVNTLPQFEAFMEDALLQTTLAVDTETSGLDWVVDHACGIVIGWGVSNNFYFPVAHKCSQPCCEGQVTHEKQLSWDDVREPLKNLLGKPTTKVLWNAKFDQHMLLKEGIALGGIIHDGVILAHLLDENVSHELKDMAVELIDPKADQLEKSIKKWRVDESKRRRAIFQSLLKTKLSETLESVEVIQQARAHMDTWVFDPTDPKYSKAHNKEYLKHLKLFAKAKLGEELKESIYYKNKKSEISYDYIPIELIYPYACADVHYTWLLYKKFVMEVISHTDLKKIYVNEMVLSEALFEAETHGIKIDKQYLIDLCPQIDAEIAQNAKDIYKEVGREFNIDSDLQLLEIIGELGIKLTKLTKGSQEKSRNGDFENLQYSVDKEVLEQLATTYPFALKVQKYRQLQKNKGTYVDGILEKLDTNSFIHPIFNQNVNTGRMSSRSPNVNAIPGRDKTIRRAFIAPNDDYMLVFMDESQIELRLLAHHSQDPALLDAYPFGKPHKDVHSITCAEIVIGCTLDELMSWEHDKTGHIESAPDCQCRACLYEHFRNIAKRVNFGIGYQAGPGAIQRQVCTPYRYVELDDCKEYIARYFKKYRGVKDWISDVTRFMKRHGYLQNSFGRYRHLPNLKSAEKWERARAERQGCNFMIQGDAADIFKTAAVRIHEIFRKNKARSRIINFVHDEVQFYWHKEEMELLKPVKFAMEDFPQFRVPILAEVSYSTTNWAAKTKIKL